MNGTWRRGAASAALATSLAAGPVARAQVPVFPIPIGPEVLVVPLLLLLIPLGMKLTQTDEKTVRDLERRGHWDAVVTLANKRLANGSDELTWREVRGRALQRSGRCALATADLRMAFDHRAAMPDGHDLAFQIGLALGLCEMQLWQLEAATTTMTGLAALAPARWEPPYNLAVLARQRGDWAALDAATAALETIDSARAAALRRELATWPAGQAESQVMQPDVPVPVPQASGPESIHGAVHLVGQHLTIGGRGLQLPDGQWVLQSSATQVIHGSTFNRVQLVDDVPLVTANVVSKTPDGNFAAAVAFTTNPVRAHGTSYWDGEDFCKVGNAIHVDRFRSSNWQSECLYVRPVDLAAARHSPQWSSIGSAGAGAGVAQSGSAYEIHYSRYGQDWMVATTWLLPSARLAGSLAAVQWARDLSAQIAPLASRKDASPALVPPLGPIN